MSVKDTELTDQNGDPIRLYGMSTHGIAWFPQYISYDTFRTLWDDWNTNCVRLALYTDEYNGYSSGGDQEELKSLIKNGIDYAMELEMYVIVDWHVLNDPDAVILVGTPTWSQNIDQAAASPLEFGNVMYTLHFYAATHTDDLRSRLETCVTGGLPVFVSEFGMCDASGNGGNDLEQADKWMDGAAGRIPDQLLLLEPCQQRGNQQRPEIRL